MANANPRPWLKWYKLKRWEQRRQALFEDQPLCVMCLQREEITVANTADHITPHRGDYDLFWYGELQPLCAACHSRDKQLEEAGHKVVHIGVDGYPL